MATQTVLMCWSLVIMSFEFVMKVFLCMTQLQFRPKVWKCFKLPPRPRCFLRCAKVVSFMSDRNTNLHVGEHQKRVCTKMFLHFWLCRSPHYHIIGESWGGKHFQMSQCLGIYHLSRWWLLSWSWCLCLESCSTLNCLHNMTNNAWWHLRWIFFFFSFLFPICHLAQIELTVDNREGPLDIYT